MEDYNGGESTYGKTITIKHYLNTKLNPTLVPNKQYLAGDKTKPPYIEKYPIYVLVNVSRQVTQIKSMLSQYVEIGQLEETLLNHSTAVEREKKLIKLSILASKPFESTDFNVSNAINNYKKLTKDFSHTIEGYLRLLIYETLKQCAFEEFTGEDSELYESYNWIDPIWREKELAKPDSNSRTIYNYGTSQPFAIYSNYDINFWTKFLSRYIPAVQELYNQMGHAVWNIKKYSNDIKKFNDLDTLSIYDWYYGNFVNAFFEHNKDEATLNALNVGVNHLRLCQPELNRLLSILE